MRCLLTLAAATMLVAAGGSAWANPTQDGRRDFDFEAGTWTIDVQRLAHPLSGSTTWVHPCCYRHVVRNLWDGASLAQLEADAPTPHVVGLMMRLYNADTGQWSVYWGSANAGAFDAPLTGTFSAGRGVFTGSDTMGHSVLVRVVYSNITPQTFRTEQLVSADKGKTWETTLIQKFTRVPDTNDRVTNGHDFDFLLGTWQTHISYLDGSTWTHITGTVVNRNLWDGNGDIEEIRAGNGSFQGMTMRLYDAKNHQWNLYWADRRDGKVGPAIAGTFSGGVGDFYDQETHDGRAVLVHQRYFGVSPTTYRFEESVSSDGGQTWKPDFIASLDRISREAVEPADPPIAALPVEQHDFDWQFGRWSVHMSRRLHPLTGSNARVEMEGAINVNKIWDGAANYVMIDAARRSAHVQFLALRTYLPQSRQWTLSFAAKGRGTLSAPMYGHFTNGVGEFYNQQLYNGQSIIDRFRFYDPTSHSAHDDEAFSVDGGRTWENEWLNTHTRYERRIASCTSSSSRCF